MAEIQNSPEPVKKGLVGKIKEAFEIGMTRKSKLPNEKGEQLERTLDERFERGEMFRILKRILAKRSAASPEEKKLWNERLRVVRDISGNLARDLDILNNQYYDPKSLKKVSVELDGENYQIPVRHYSLKKLVGQQNEPPLIVLGGAASGHKVTKSAVEAFALQYPGRDVYVVSYPDNLAAEIPESFAKRIKGQEGLDIYTRLLKKTINNLGFDKFDLIGISMGGGIGIGMGKDREFAKRIRNLMIVSPTNLQKNKNIVDLSVRFGSELLHGKFHPKEYLRVGKKQAGGELGTHKGTGFAPSVHVVRRKMLGPDDLSQVQVSGRIILMTGEKDLAISGKQTLQEADEANKKREKEGKTPIERCLILGAHHNMGDAYAAGYVRLIRETETVKLPSEYPVSRLENSTAKVLVREDPRLAPVADQIIGGRSF